MAKKAKKEPTPLLFRHELELKKEDYIPNEGMQEQVLLSDADITICGGNRGGGKSYALILDPLYDIHNPNFGGMFFRKETGELEKKGGLYDKSASIYPILGAKGTKLKFVFPSGAYLMYDHLQNEDEKSIEKRFKGLEIPYIGIDELDQISFPTFLKLMQSNRNAFGIRNRIIGTCNPNSESWLRTFLDFYITDEGYIDPERDCKTIYFYVYGQDVQEIIWGETKEKLYEKAKSYIDSAWSDRFLDAGLTRFDLIKSLKFVKGDVAENKKLLESQPSYVGNIAQGGAAAIARNLDGNWNVRAEGSELVKRSQMDYMFDEFRPALKTGVKYLSIDVALLGLDNFVATLWDGDHIEDIFIKEKLDSAEAVVFVRTLMMEHGVREENVCYDNIGNGQALNCLKRAFPINAQATPIGTEVAYDNLKSQILYSFGRAIIEGKITCSPAAANKMLPYGKGAKKERMPFREVLQNERRALMVADTSGKTKMANKKAMKAILGHSPDIMESVAYKQVFNLQSKKQSKGIRGLGYL